MNCDEPPSTSGLTMLVSVGALIDLPEAVAHHLHVLRLAPGDELTLFNGDGGEHLAHLVHIEKRRASAEVKAYVAREAELPSLQAIWGST